MYPAGQQFSRSGQQTAFGRGQHEYSQGLIHGQHVSNILHITPSGHTLHVVRFNDGVSIVEVNGTVRSTGVFLFNSLADENVTKYRINSAGDEMTEHFIFLVTRFEEENRRKVTHSSTLLLPTAVINTFFWDII